MFGIGFWEMMLLAIIGLPVFGGIVAAIVIVALSQRRKEL
jgi:hypothetical protein